MMRLKYLLPASLILQAGITMASGLDDAVSLMQWPEGQKTFPNPPGKIEFSSSFSNSLDALVAYAKKDNLEKGACIYLNDKNLTLGDIVHGEEFSISLMAENCDKPGFVGMIHTHPEFKSEDEGGEYIAVPSIVDFSNNSYRPFPLSIVAHKKYMCATFRSPTSEGVDFENQAQADDYKDHMADYAVSMLSQIPTEGGSITRLTRQAIADVEGKYGQLLYCGSIGQPLKRIAPKKIQASARTMTLATQGFMLAQYLAGNEKYAPPTYQFSPYDKSGIVKYLNRTFKGEKFDGLPPEALFRKVLKLHWDGIDSFAAMSGAVSIPVKSKSGRSFLFLCADKTCQVASGKTFSGIDPNDKNNAHAFFQDTEDGYTSTIATSMTERKIYNIISDSPISLIYSEIYKGNDKWVGKPGSAVYTFDQGYAVGNVVDNMIVSPIKIHLKDGRVYNGDIDSAFHITFKDQVE